MNRPIVIGTALFFLFFGILFFFLKHRSTGKPAGSSKGAKSTAEKMPERQINVKLFFSDQGALRLTPEDRAVTYRESLHAQAREVLNALIAGPKGNLTATIPPGTKLLEVFVAEEGVAYVDFSEELVSGHRGGSTGEITTVYSIVNTLTFNLPQIKKVQILVNDRAVETLKGHLDLSRPLQQDLSIAKLSSLAKGEKTQHEI